MYNVICDVINYCVRSCDMGQEVKFGMIKSKLKTGLRYKMEIKEIFTRNSIKTCFRNGIHSSYPWYMRVQFCMYRYTYTVSYAYELVLPIL